ncbi:unnamed protein product [Adineta ricciae]|uniref:Tctex1 domain-containing protein 2 n=1 Tax=Adineta ricciae TaxID=249248 RepID=A0A814WR86_ADIRI|nr:unnamed protein product [Adineta ricciae]CAF1205697.1 unnamed protein product [Adineta ricciae]
MSVTSPRTIFDSQDMKRRLHEILHENLHDKRYDSNQCSSLSKDLANRIKDALKRFGYERYKFVIQVLICQEYNENIQMNCRAYWDSETDRLAQTIYMNQFLICIATAFAVYYY